jgi:hypothetical protein
MSPVSLSHRRLGRPAIGPMVRKGKKSDSIYVKTSNAGIRSYEPLPIPFVWPRSSLHGPLSERGGSLPTCATATKALGAPAHR